LAADDRVRLQNEAEKFMLQGKTSQAIDEYLKIIHNYPEDVLTLNTAGDLYLSIGRPTDANDCFIKVANNYVRNNFLLKAIAVYKKILRTNPDNLEINNTLASLFARQGLNIEACNQYFRLAELYGKSGNTDMVLQIYQGIVDLDPANASIQKKLAEVFLAEQENEKGCEHLLNAARALSRSGDHNAAMDCYNRVVQMNPLDLDALKGFMQCCLKTGNISTILNPLKESLAMDPDNLDIKEMLGEAYLDEGNPEGAVEILQTVISSDESRYECLIPAIETLIDQEKCDQASESLDLIIPILITRHKMNLAVQYCEQILQLCTLHIPTMDKLASLYLSAGDISNHLEMLDKIADFYMEEKNSSVALEYLEKILQADPESKKHLDLHKVAFVDTHPDTPYVPPEPPSDLRIETGSTQDLQKTESKTGDSPESIVEADLLINYGMKEKALGMLQNMEASNPNDKKVRTRLLMLYKEEERFTEAAEQCLLLTALFKKSSDEESAGKYLTEAKQLDPDLVEREHNLDLFARKKGIITLTASDTERELKSNAGIDLSDDLLDIFFAEKKENIPEELSDIPSISNEISEEYTEELPPAAPTQSIDEKLQEVDFYIRLGFSDEASSKLNEIAKISPDNPELSTRYEKLKELETLEDQADTAKSETEVQESAVSAEAIDEEDVQIFEDVDIDATLDDISENPPDSAASNESIDFSSLEQQDDATGFEVRNSTDIEEEPASQESEPVLESVDFSSLEQQDITKEDSIVLSEFTDSIDNAMFSDLLEEDSSLNEQEIKQESFEDHFSLGTAYRDMDLIDESVKEFQTALRIAEYKKDSRKLIQCCGMLSTCFIKKSMPRSALRWCKTGLKVSHISEQETMALRYDMGVSHTMEGNPELALQCFDQIFSIDPGYRDVALKIDEIKSGRKQV